MIEIERLETLPLLGTTREHAVELADKLAYQVNPDTHPEEALRVLICRFLAQSATPQTLSQLATAEAWATQEGLTHIATRIQLLWCAEIGRSHGDAVDTALLEAAVDTAEALQICDVEVMLAKAACTTDHRDTLLKTALQHMNEPRWAGLAYRAWLDLAAALHDGADINGSTRALDAALQLSIKHQDSSCEARARSLIGIQLLNRGLPAEAQAQLEEALVLARADEDDLSTVMLTSLLCPMYLSQEAWSAAEHTADIMLVAGARRANWFAVVDGHITRSTLSLIHGDAAAAISRLVRAAVHLRELVPAAAINLLKGRLAELRHHLGAEAFDTHYRAAMKLNAQS